MNRISHLDGMRGLAILFVVLFHAFYRWSEIEPWQINPILRSLSSYGWIGVELFFIISGYVIFLTLDRNLSMLSFVKKRWFRLFPAMLAISVFIYVTAPFIPERPLGIPNYYDFFPGVLFLDPVFFKGFFGDDVRSLDGAFWSIYIEVKFYLISGFLYYYVKDKVGWGVLCLFGAFVLFGYFDNLFSDWIRHKINLFFGLVGVEYYGWFLVGIFLYRFQMTDSVKYLIVSLVSGFFAVYLIFEKNGILPGIISLVVIGLFYSVFYSSVFRRFFSIKPLVYLGFISYPLYLLHQNFVTGLSVKLHSLYSVDVGEIYPVVSLLLTILLSYGIARYEPLFRDRLKSILLVVRWK